MTGRIETKKKRNRERCRERENVDVERDEACQSNKTSFLSKRQKEEEELSANSFLSAEREKTLTALSIAVTSQCG